MKKTVVNILVFLVSTCLCWLSLSIVMHFKYRIDERSPIEVIADNFEAGSVSFLNILPYNFIEGSAGPMLRGAPLPPGIEMMLGTVPLIRTVYCQEDRGFYEFNSDRFGFNNNDTSWDSDIDILMLGDSFAEGACIKQNIRFFLSKKHNVITLGKGGNGPLTTYATAVEFLKYYSAKHVFWIVASNDLANVHAGETDYEREKASPTIARYLGDKAFSQDYFATPERFLEFSKNVRGNVQSIVAANTSNIETSRALRGSELYRVLSGFYLRKKVAQMYHALKAKPGKPRKFRIVSETEIDEIASLMTLVNKEQNRRGGRFTVVFLPSNGVCDGWNETLPYDPLIKRLDSHGVDTIDQSVLTWCDENIYPVKRPGHYNETGYKRIAAKIAEKFSGIGH